MPRRGSQGHPVDQGFDEGEFHLLKKKRWRTDTLRVVVSTVFEIMIS